MQNMYAVPDSRLQSRFQRVRTSVALNMGSKFNEDKRAYRSLLQFEKFERSDIIDLLQFGEQREKNLEIKPVGGRLSKRRRFSVG